MILPEAQRAAGISILSVIPTLDCVVDPEDVLISTDRTLSGYATVASMQLWITGGLPVHFWSIEPERVPSRILVDEACRQHGVTPAEIMPMLA